jgi:hypothetical protein
MRRKEKTMDQLIKEAKENAPLKGYKLPKELTERNYIVDGKTKNGKLILRRIPYGAEVLSDGSTIEIGSGIKITKPGGDTLYLD